ncbi:Dihydroxy-acid/6-phosphogluconate dehydratase [Trichophyton rubrum]|nr:Dihydroxy-acid/6-phosphogluconate dehydratase [Trichophyton rubrum]
MVLVTVTGGSTNAVLHLIAIADSVGIKLTIDDFQAVSDRVPFLADLKPSGKYVMADLHNIGGTPVLNQIPAQGGPHRRLRNHGDGPDAGQECREVP